jgi:hypothetical protein
VMHRSGSLVSSSVVLSLVASLAGAQSPVSLGARTTASEETFTRITGLRELADGRVIVADADERRLVLLAADLKEATTLGRNGSGPREYLAPTAILPWLADSTIVIDPTAQRALLIDERGSIVSDRTLVQSFGGFTMSPSVAATDRSGGMYYTGIAARDRQRGTQADTVPIIRITFSGTRPDTIAWVRIAVAPTSARQEGGQMAFRRAAPDPFGTVDAWGVAPDGGVAIVRGQEYHSEWYRSGKLSERGANIPVTPIPVTAEDLAEIAARRAAAANRSTSFGGGGQAPSVTAPPVEDATISKVKPPFVTRTMPLDPQGRAWVHRTRHANDRIPVYDVFDVTGTRVAQISLPPNATVVGFGKTHVYLAIADKNDLVTLGKYPLPR